MDGPVLSFGQDKEECFLKKKLTWIDRMNRIKDIKQQKFSFFILSIHVNFFKCIV
jgi:hypothetical protein